ncbi:MAG: YebC/PmpR family DNA-binding transcriptional regulator [Bacteroidales bacterium]|nr:YebC/PmpR family DNA-binding transcriptional regulator [Bacteroidales bacterium]
MGRAFEYRKARKLKRWGNMARTFTRIGKDITLAVKSGGTDPVANPRLRVLLQMAKAAAMPKENVERAIRKATDKDASADYKEVAYSGYGPYGVAIVVETVTNNTTRTVANVRSYFTHYGGTLGNIGSLDFMFERKCVFRVRTKPEVDLEELELDLIDYGADELFSDGDETVIYGAFESYGKIQKYLEDHDFFITSGEFERIPADFKDVTAGQAAEIDKLLQKLEEDEDVQNIFHNMRQEE